MKATRTCEFCGVDISDRRADAQRCRARRCKAAAERRSIKASGNTCTVVEDGNPCPNLPRRRRHAEGVDVLCDKHDRRAKRYGSPLAARAKRRKGGVVQALLEEAAWATTEDCIFEPSPTRGRLSVSYRSRPMTAARAVWMIASGEDPGKQHVLHSCHRGEDGCINIRHLYLGNADQNARDRIEAGREVRGEAVWNSEFTQEQVREIRSLLEAGISQATIAARFGRSQGTISDIAVGKTWAWLD